MTQSSDSQRHSLPAEGALPGEDDMAVAPDEAMADARAAAGDPQQTDPGGYPHAPSPDVPGVRTDPAAPAAGGREPMQPEQPAGPGEHGAQTTPDDEQERREKGSA